MKIEQLITQYLYNNKKVSLQDIGVFYLSPDIAVQGENDKENYLPDNAITFEYNTKAVQDEGLINFIVQQTRKIKPLATSDLESFSILGRQFMNIGKPLPIEGLGILQKNQSGMYEFVQGHSINPKLEPLPAQLKEKEKRDIVFTTPSRKPENKAGIIAAILVIALLAIGGTVYYLLKENKTRKAEKAVSELTQQDSSGKRKDSAQKIAAVAPDTIVAEHAANDGYTFKIVLKDYNSKEAANKAYERLSRYGHKLLLYSTDSSYKIAMPFKTPLTDTLHAKDSVRIYFGGYPYIEIN